MPIVFFFFFKGLALLSFMVLAELYWPRDLTDYLSLFLTPSSLSLISSTIDFSVSFIFCLERVPCFIMKDPELTFLVDSLFATVGVYCTLGGAGGAGFKFILLVAGTWKSLIAESGSRSSQRKWSSSLSSL